MLAPDGARQARSELRVHRALTCSVCARGRDQSLGDRAFCFLP